MKKVIVFHSYAMLWGVFMFYLFIMKYIHVYDLIKNQFIFMTLNIYKNCWSLTNVLFYIYLSICNFGCLSICFMSIYLSVCFSIYLFVCIWLSVRLWVIWNRVKMNICVRVCVCVLLWTCVFLSLSNQTGTQPTSVA